MATPLALETAPLFALFALAPLTLRLGASLRAAVWLQSLSAYVTLAIFGLQMGDAVVSSAAAGALLLITVCAGTAGDGPPPERLTAIVILAVMVGATNVYLTRARRRAHRVLIEARRRACG